MEGEMQEIADLRGRDGELRALEAIHEGCTQAREEHCRQQAAIQKAVRS